jgi:hypothetical protein
MKVMTDGKDNVKVWAGKSLESSTLKPQFSFRHTTMRAAPVLA